MINEFSVSRFRELVNEGVGAILIIIPADLDSITEDLKEVVWVIIFVENKWFILFFLLKHIAETERFLLSQEVSIPIFFSPHTKQVDEIYSNIIESTNKDSAPSAAQGIVSDLSLLNAKY